jgi:hypothetical protein
MPGHACPAFVPRTTGRRQETTGMAGASNPQVRNRIRASPQVAKSAPRTLSRWRHGFEPRWDYEEKPQVTSRIATRTDLTGMEGRGQITPDPAHIDLARHRSVQCPAIDVQPPLRVDPEAGHDRPFPNWNECPSALIIVTIARPGHRTVTPCRRGSIDQSRLSLERVMPNQGFPCPSRAGDSLDGGNGSGHLHDRRRRRDDQLPVAGYSGSGPRSRPFWIAYRISS